MIGKILKDKACPGVVVSRSLRFNDEPHFHQYDTTIVNDSLPSRFNRKVWGGGLSVKNRREARTRSIAEALERYSTSLYKNNPGQKKFRVKKVIDNCLNPLAIPSLTTRIDTNSVLNWIKGWETLNNKELWIPSQLVFVPYEFLENEPIMRFPISTGSAFGRSREEAIFKGICEIIERDAFMAAYLQKLDIKRLHLNSQKELKRISDYLERYLLKLFVFDITNDLEIPVAMAILVDNSGVGPRVSVGLKCSSSIYTSTLGAIEEAQHSRQWMRTEKNITNAKRLKKIVDNPKEIDTLKERGLYWYNKDPFKYLGFWLKTENLEKVNWGMPIKNNDRYISELDVAVRILKRKRLKAYCVDLTPKFIKRHRYWVIKTIIPDLQPLYLEEPNPLIIRERVVCQIPNSIPHPFL